MQKLIHQKVFNSQNSFFILTKDDIKDIQEIINSLENKIKNGKEKIYVIDLDKKKEIENIYQKYEYKVNKIKELFSKHFLYE